MLLAVMLVGQSALGAQRWISIGPISIQPSEFSKLIMIVSLATMLEDRVGKLNTLHDLMPVGSLCRCAVSAGAQAAGPWDVSWYSWRFSWA
jgi:cell division protein FtsW (lipid II flippase)